MTKYKSNPVKSKTGMKQCNRIKAKHIDFALTE